jgi:hypothetical protein
MTILYLARFHLNYIQMKKLYIMALFAVAATAGYSQSMSVFKPFTRGELSPLATKRQERPESGTALRTVYLQEDFEGVAGPYPANLPQDWITPNVADINSNQIPAFKVHTSTTANNGGYWPVAETGTDFGVNQFAGANDDGAPCNCTLLDAYIQAPPVDLTTATNPAVMVDIYNDGQFLSGDAFLEVSVDGGLTFSQISYSAESAALPVESAWQTLVIPVYNLVGNASVIFRFTWTDDGEWASGFAIDNFVIGDLDNNNLRMDKVVFGNWNQFLIDGDFGNGVWEYSRTPLRQAQPLRVTGVVSNNGFVDQPNTYINFELSQNGSNLGTPFASDISSNLLVSLDKDTLNAVTTITPTALGTITVRATAASDSTDATPADNLAVRTTEITNYTYAMDAGSAEAFFTSEDAAPYEIGNVFYFTQTDTLGSVDVCINPRRSTSGADLSLGATIYARIYEVLSFDLTTATPNLSAILYETQEHEVTANDYTFVGESNFVTLTFGNGNTILEGGKLYLVDFVSAGDVRIAISGSNQFVASFVKDSNGWAPRGSHPMVRLNTDVTVSVAEAGKVANLSLGQNMPNPATEITTIPYSLQSNEHVSIIVRDVTGRVVLQNYEGFKSAGKNNITLNLNGFESGLYTYTLVAGQESMTRQLVVN